MSYDFWIDINAAGNLGSGCTESLSPDWTGTVDISGTAVTKVSGDAFPAALLDGNHFLRIDPGGANDSNVRIASGTDTTLTLAMSGGTLGGKTGAIGGAFNDPIIAIGGFNSPSKIPYSDGLTGSIPGVINIYVKPGVYTLSSNYLYLTSATQATYSVRRNIIGYNSGFTSGEFSENYATFVQGSEQATNPMLYIGAPSVTINGIKFIGHSTSNDIAIEVSAHNTGLRHVWITGCWYGVYSNTASSSTLTECLIENTVDAAITGYNTAAFRCVVKGCGKAFSGILSTFCECVEYNTSAYLGVFTSYPANSDFSFCRFTSNKSFNFTKGQLTFSRCTFDYPQNWSANGLGNQGGDLHVDNCLVNGAFVPLLNTAKNIFPIANTVVENSGIDNFGSVFEPATNLISHYPDPILDRYCKYTTAGPHEYRFPVEAVGARALRNRQRVSKSEIGL